MWSAEEKCAISKGGNVKFAQHMEIQNCTPSRRHYVECMDEGTNRPDIHTKNYNVAKAILTFWTFRRKCAPRRDEMRFLHFVAQWLFG